MNEIQLIILMADSFLQNDKTLFLKTIKVGMISRLFSIFRVDRVLFYHDGGDDEDINVIKEISEYLNIAPYLKRIIKKKDSLKFSAILPPIQGPNQLGVSYKGSSYFEGYVSEISKKRNNNYVLRVDIGQNKPIEIHSDIKDVNNPTLHDFIVVRSKEQKYSIEIEENLPFYWKTYYELNKIDLKNYLKDFNSETFIISASRSGETLNIENMKQLRSDLIGYKKLVIIFGPLEGSLIEYFTKNQINTDKINKTLNFIPNQGTKTVRLEEAINSTLSIINLL